MRSFNQLSWEGLQSFGGHTGADVRVLESKQASDYLTNIDRETDTYSDLVYGGQSIQYVVGAPSEIISILIGTIVFLIALKDMVPVLIDKMGKRGVK